MEGTREGKCINKHGCRVWGEYFRAQVKLSLHTSTLQNVHRMFGVSTNGTNPSWNFGSENVSTTGPCINTDKSQELDVEGKQPSHK